MVLLAECGLAAGRAAAVSAAALAAGFAVRGFMRRAPGPVRPWAWALLLAPLLTPAALTGYAWADFALMQDPPARQVFYALILWLKLTSVAALALYFSPSGLSAEAAHCHRLMMRGRLAGLRGTLFEFRAMARAAAVAAALVFLLAFSDFDLASLLYVESWTVKLFDAHVGRVDLPVSLRLVALPLLIELGVIVALLVLLARSARPEAPGESGRRAGWRSWAFPASFLLGAAGVLTIGPLAVVLKGAVRGLAEVRLGREIAVSLFFACATALAAYGLAGLAPRQTGCGTAAQGGAAGRRRKDTGEGPRATRAADRLRWWLLTALCVPGLAGPLVLSLALVEAFQTGPLWRLYDTPLPLLLGLTALFLPFAVALRQLLRLYRPGEALHAAELLRASPDAAVRGRGARLAALLRARGRFWALALLFCWAWFDLTASAILAPTGMTPLFVFLYNQIHYGRSYTLSAMLCVAVAVPALALLAAGGARAVYIRTRFHV